MGGPLPGTRPPRQAPGLLGVYRAEVAAIGPLMVTVPRLTGPDRVGPCESALFDTPLEVGDPVWVVPLEGRRDDLVVIARRA